jgi:hypothetical protein
MLATCDNPVQFGIPVSASNPGTFNGTFSAPETRVTVQILDKNFIEITDELPATLQQMLQPWRWSIALGGNVLQPNGPPVPPTAPQDGSFYRCVVSFYEGDTLTTLLTVRFYTSP